MDGHEGLLDKLSHFVHKHLLWLLIGSYAIEALLAVARPLDQDVRLGEIALFGSKMRIDNSMLMLASLLLNAGLGVQVGQDSRDASQAGFWLPGWRPT